MQAYQLEGLLVHVKEDEDSEKGSEHLETTEIEKKDNEFEAHPLNHEEKLETPEYGNRALASEDSALGSNMLAEGPVFQPLPSCFPKDFFSTRSHPWNRAGFRYQPCGRAWRPVEDGDEVKHPGTEGARKLDAEAIDELYNRVYWRTIESPPPGLVRWSWEDRSSYVHITRDGLSVTTDRGFRSARANIPIRQGKWFFEVILRRAGGELNSVGRSDPEEAHVRVGIARRESGLNAPVGIDGYSYGIRDKTGQKVHLSRVTSYGERFGSGDMIGVLVELPSLRKAVAGDIDDPARIERRRVPIRYRRQLYFESAEYPVSKEMEELADAASREPSRKPSKTEHAVPGNHTDKAPSDGAQIEEAVEESDAMNDPHLASGRGDFQSLPVLKGSRLTFFKNGVSQGVAFHDLYDFLPLRNNRAKDEARRTSADVDSGRETIKSEGANSETLHDDGTLGYYPCVSVYGGGIATLNAGPEFKFPPVRCTSNSDTGQKQSMEEPPDLCKLQDQAEDEVCWRPLSELYPIYLSEQRALDESEAIDQGSGERLDNGDDGEQLVATKKAGMTKRKRTNSPTVPTTGSTAPVKGVVGRKKKVKISASRFESPPNQNYSPGKLGSRTPSSLADVTQSIPEGAQDPQGSRPGTAPSLEESRLESKSVADS